MARVIEAVQIFKKVEDVTAAKDDPSPVYLMDELADMAKGSTDSSEKIADRIAKRLQNKSPVVKFKALRLIRHLLNKGCGHFQRCMQRHAELVRSHIHFKGEPDPYKGDAPNQKVRDAGKEAADALFNTVMAQPVNGLGSRIQGFGSSASSAQSSNHSNHGGGSGPGSFSGAASSGASASRMVGFGSGGYAAPAAAGAGGNGTASSVGFGGFGFAQKGVNRPLTSGYGNDAATRQGSAGSSGGHGGGGGGYSAPAVAASEVLGSEEQLVDSVCTPGGMRLAPDPDDLRRFVEAVSSLDGLKVAELLRDKMDASGPWQQQLRALYALEAVLLQGASQACGEVAVLFQSDPGPVQAAAAHTQPALRERAAKVLKLLVGDDAAAVAAPAKPAVQQQQQPAPAPVDLLGGLDMLGSPVRAQPAPPTQQQQHPVVAAAAGGDMFSGLAVPAGPAGFQQNPYHSQPTSAAAPRPAVVDPFEPIQSIAPSTSSATPAPQPYTQQPHLQPQQWQPQQGAQQSIGPGSSNPAGAGAGGALGGRMPAQGQGAAAAASGPLARPPLDDMFADMSLSGAGPGARAAPQGYAGHSSANTYGGGGGAYSGASQSYGAPAVGGATNTAGYAGGAMGQPGHTGPYNMGGPQTHGSFAVAGASGVGTPVAVTNHHGGPQAGYPSGTGPGMGLGMALGGQLPPQQAGRPAQPPLPQQQQYTVAPPSGGDLLGGGVAPDLLGGRVPMSGPSGGPGMGGWLASGGSAGYNAGGPGLTGGPSGPGMGMGMGLMSGEAGVGMMVGPGGQVRYVGGPVGLAAPVMGGMAGGLGAGANPHQSYQTAGGQVGPAAGQGGWQHQPYSVAQQAYSAGGQQAHQHTAGPGISQQRSGGGAAFDFVMDQFKK